MSIKPFLSLVTKELQLVESFDQMFFLMQKIINDELRRFHPINLLVLSYQAQIK